MDLATIIGLVGGFAILLAAILVDSTLGTFINVPSLLIVMGGTIAAVMVKFPLKHLLGSIKVGMKAFREEVTDADDLIDTTVELSRVVRKDGLLALENQNVSDPFLKKGLRLCADGLEPEAVRKILSTDMRESIQRHKTGQRIFRGIGDSAPAMGMIGTLIGLVQMLTMMEDPSEIGPAMAVALLTTLYGAVMANLVALPMAEKLALRAKQERVNRSLIIEGVNALQESLNPRVVEELLRSYLPDSAGNSGGGQGRAGARQPAMDAV